VGEKIKEETCAHCGEAKPLVPLCDPCAYMPKPESTHCQDCAELLAEKAAEYAISNGFTPLDRQRDLK
jgi:hypothetical protein